MKLLMMLQLLLMMKVGAVVGPAVVVAIAGGGGGDDDSVIVGSALPLQQSNIPYCSKMTKNMSPFYLLGQFGAPRQVEALFLHALGSVPKDGFFVEAGAYDGEYISHSLLFEVGHGWGGILVEPNPDALKNLRSKNRYMLCFLFLGSKKIKMENSQAVEESQY